MTETRLDQQTQDDIRALQNAVANGDIREEDTPDGGTLLHFRPERAAELVSLVRRVLTPCDDPQCMANAHGFTPLDDDPPF